MSAGERNGQSSERAAVEETRWRIPQAVRAKQGVSAKFCIRDTTYRHLLAQEIEVFFAVAQTLLGGAELVCEELFGFGDGVGEHDVGLVW